MTDEELKKKCTERAKIFQQAMESCHSSSPIDCIEWFADRIAELEHQLTHRNCVDCSNHSSKLRMRTLELEKENAFLKGRNEGFELQIMGLLIKYEEVYKRFPDLKSAMDKAKEVLKENAELKSGCGMCYRKDKEQLTKAKEIIENLLYYVKQCTCERSNYAEIEEDIKEAEQFIKEIK